MQFRQKQLNFCIDWQRFGKDLGYKPGKNEQAKFEYSPLSNVFKKGSREKDKEERILKSVVNIRDADEKQLQAVKDEYLKLVKRIKDNKHKLKSLRYETNEQDKEQLEYFDSLVKLELGIDIQDKLSIRL